VTIAAGPRLQVPWPLARAPAVLRQAPGPTPTRDGRHGAARVSAFCRAHLCPAGKGVW